MAKERDPLFDFLLRMEVGGQQSARLYVQGRHLELITSNNVG